MLAEKPLEVECRKFYALYANIEAHGHMRRCRKKNKTHTQKEKKEKNGKHQKNPKMKKKHKVQTNRKMYFSDLFELCVLKARSLVPPPSPFQLSLGKRTNSPLALSPPPPPQRATGVAFLLVRTMKSHASFLNRCYVWEASFLNQFKPGNAKLNGIWKHAVSKNWIDGVRVEKFPWIHYIGHSRRDSKFYDLITV